MQYGSLGLQHISVSAITVITHLSYPKQEHTSTIPLDSQRSSGGRLEWVLLLQWHGKINRASPGGCEAPSLNITLLFIYLMYELLWFNMRLQPHQISARQTMLQEKNKSSILELKPPWPTVGSSDLPSAQDLLQDLWHPSVLADPRHSS